MEESRFGKFKFVEICGGVVIMSRKTGSTDIRRLVLDVLKPHSPALPDFATKLSSLSGVDGVNVTLIEIDKDTETLKVTLEGKLDYGKIRSSIEDWGGVVHSVDEVTAGSLAVSEDHSTDWRLKYRTKED